MGWQSSKPKCSLLLFDQRSLERRERVLQTALVAVIAHWLHSKPRLDAYKIQIRQPHNRRFHRVAKNSAATKLT
ncbi:hypothetical protein GBA52_001054 [Prunus armeniaca]|nr:hypothetical protein GBA52_001054 [Prunus armeniaca]